MYKLHEALAFSSFTCDCGYLFTVYHKEKTNTKCIKCPKCDEEYYIRYMQRLVLPKFEVLKVISYGTV